MAKFWIQQIFKMLSLLLGVSLLAFLLLSMSPINPLHSNFSQTQLGSLSSEQLFALENYWGMHEPFLKRYLNWLGGFLQGDMGVSLLYRQEVSVIIFEKLKNSLLITFFAWIFSGFLGFWLGMVSGSRKNSYLDTVITKICLVLAAIPAFWVGLLFLMIFAVWLNLFPVGFSAPIGLNTDEIRLWHKLYHALLPALCLSIVGLPAMVLHTREKTLEVMQSDYVLFAKARGESFQYIVKHHALRNLVLPGLTLQFASIGEILGASILIEQVFSYPGLGEATVQAGLGGDLPLLMSIAVITTALVFCGNLFANVLYFYIDPRLKG